MTDITADNIRDAWLSMSNELEHSINGNINELAMKALNVGVARATLENDLHCDGSIRSAATAASIVSLTCAADELNREIVRVANLVRGHIHVAFSAENDGFVTIQDSLSQLSAMVLTATCAAESASRTAKDALADKGLAEFKLANLTSRGALNPQIRAEVYALTGGHCYYCDAGLILSSVPDDLAANIPFGPPVMHIDHLVPVSHGGPDHISNFVPACPSCNTSKGNRSYVEFVRDRHPRLKLVVNT